MFLHAKLKRRTKLQLMMAKMRLLWMENEQHVDMNEKAERYDHVTVGTGGTDRGRQFLMPKKLT